MKPRSSLCALAAGIALAGCATIRRNEAAFDGNLLTAAGFTRRPADTSSIPPREIVTENEDDHLVYRYADPNRCGCQYVGDQRAYAEYRQLVREEFLDALLSLRGLP